jgi:hypothetical protein
MWLLSTCSADVQQAEVPKATHERLAIVEDDSATEETNVKVEE